MTTYNQSHVATRLDIKSTFAVRTSELMLSLTSIPFGWSLFLKVSIWEYGGNQPLFTEQLAGMD